MFQLSFFYSILLFLRRIVYYFKFNSNKERYRRSLPTIPYFKVPLPIYFQLFAITITKCAYKRSVWSPNFFPRRNVQKVSLARENATCSLLIQNI